MQRVLKNHTHWAKLLGTTYRGITRAIKALPGGSCEGALDQGAELFGMLWGINRIL